MANYLEMNNYFVPDLEKDNTSHLPVFAGAIEKVMKLYE